MIALVGAAVTYARYRDVEEPDYTVLIEDEPFELRQYGSMIVAEVSHDGSRREASSRSFNRLAAYIFAKDRPAGGEKIEMTAPVLQDRGEKNEKIAMTAPVLQDRSEDDRWRMRFVMPAEYAIEDLPEPPADISLNRIPARRIAAVRFSGNGSPGDLARMEKRLTDWIMAHGLRAKGEFEYAFYDAPMVPGPLRRNEVMIEIAGADGE
jgi:effector-binding domain-containing protein